MSIKAIQEKIEALEVEVRTLRAENHTFREEVLSLRVENHTFREEVHSLRVENQTLRTYAERLEQNIEGLTMRLEKSDKMIREVRGRSHEIEVFMHKDLEEMRKKNDLLTTRTVDYEKRIHHGKIAIGETEAKLGAIRSNL